MSFQKLFWQKVKKLDGDDACWLWTAATNASGYGIVGVGRSSRLAHRVAYEMTNGPIPAGKLLRHRCDTPSCVRPDHMTPGSDKENMQDQIQRGRRASKKGSQNGRAKLTREQVVEIRRRYVRGQTRIVDLAAEFGVGKSQIWNIVSGREWNEYPNQLAMSN